MIENQNNTFDLDKVNARLEEYRDEMTRIEDVIIQYLESLSLEDLGDIGGHFLSNRPLRGDWLYLRNQYFRLQLLHTITTAYVDRFFYSDDDDDHESAGLSFEPVEEEPEDEERAAVEAALKTLH